MIYYFKPFSTEKNIGVYNDHCRIVPNNDDWILIQDYDSMVLSVNTFTVIEAAIKRYPDTAVFGAMTNRVGYSFQRHEGIMSENVDIKHHIALAEDLAARFGDGECEVAKSVAGFFMLFKKSYWNDNPFQETIFNEKRDLFDYQFCLKAKREKLPIRIIKGVYVWHTYRINKISTKDTSHLKCYTQSKC